MTLGLDACMYNNVHIREHVDFLTVLTAIFH